MFRAEAELLLGKFLEMITKGEFVRCWKETDSKESKEYFLFFTQIFIFAFDFKNVIRRKKG